MEVPGPDSDWRSPQFRQKVVAQIEEAMRKAGTAHTKSSNDMENHVYVKAKSREEYLSLVARLIIHFRDIRKYLNGTKLWNPMNTLTNLTGVGGGPGAIGMGPRPTGAPVGGMGAMGPMQIGQHAMAGVAGNPQAIGGPGQMPMQQMVQSLPDRLYLSSVSLRCEQLPTDGPQKYDVQTAAAAGQTLSDGTAQHLGSERPPGLSVCTTVTNPQHTLRTSLRTQRTPISTCRTPPRTKGTL
uniref:Mediator of RNA polymerase II transcription subunit 15 n=1 Tax=Seriola lalandi dorsalis TaxID=1841481 RepID=A0A3B4XLF1_SERLL